MPTYEWTRSIEASESWFTFDTDHSAPDVIFELGVPLAPHVTLMRTVADIRYSRLASWAGTEIIPPPGIFEVIDVATHIWVDPTGVVPSAQVPRPFRGSAHIPPVPVWEGTLYPSQSTVYLGDLTTSTCTWRPLAQINSKARRKSTSDAGPAAWIVMQPRTSVHWAGDGITQEYCFQYSVSMLWELADE